MRSFRWLHVFFILNNGNGADVLFQEISAPEYYEKKTVDNSPQSYFIFSGKLFVT